MKSRTTLTYAVALATAATLTLAGCNGGEDQPSPTPTSSGSSSSSTTATPSPSVTASGSPTATSSATATIPPEARANSEDGAVAFVRFYFDEINAAYRSPSDASARRILQISTPTCRSCSAGAEDVRSLARAGQRLDSPAFAPLTGLSAQTVAETRIRVSFTMSQRAAKVLDSNGQVVDEQVSKSQPQIAALVWKENSWHMDGLAAA